MKKAGAASLLLLYNALPHAVRKCLMPQEFPFARDLSNLVFPRARLVYVAIPKAACTSLKAYFAGVFGHRLAERRFRDYPLETQVHHYNFRYMHKAALARTPFKGYFKFAVVRDPVERLVSCYDNKIGSDPAYSDHVTRNGIYFQFARFCEDGNPVFYAGMPLEEFCDRVCAIPDREADAHFMAQYCFVTLRGQLLTDRLIRLPRLEEEFPRLCREHGLPVRPLPHLMSTRGQGAASSSRLGATRVERIRDRYVRDYELLSGHA